MGLKHLFKKPVTVKVVTSQDVVDHLTELNDQAFKQILKIVAIYREADKKVAKITASNEPSITLADVEIPYLADPIKNLIPKPGKLGKMGAKQSKPKAEKNAKA